MRFLDLFAETPNGRPKAQEAFDRFKTGTSLKDVELEMKNRSGNLVWISLSTKPVSDEHGDVIENRLVAIDISERKFLETQLIQSQKMESLGVLVAGVAHDINTNLNSITSNAPVLEKIWHDVMPILEKHAQKEPQRKYAGLPYHYLKENLEQLISGMATSADRITKTINSLRKFARPSHSAMKRPVQINETVINALKLAQPTVTELGIDCSLDLGNDLPLLKDDLQGIEQVMLNLILNAAQAIDHENSTIQITTGYLKQEQSIVVEIADNGPGIDAFVSDKIFDPFFTTRQAEGGHWPGSFGNL